MHSSQDQLHPSLSNSQRVSRLALFCFVSVYVSCVVLSVNMLISACVYVLCEWAYIFCAAAESGVSVACQHGQLAFVSGRSSLVNTARQQSLYLLTCLRLAFSSSVSVPFSLPVLF